MVTVDEYIGWSGYDLVIAREEYPNWSGYGRVGTIKGNQTGLDMIW
jgi:hypothetical protein